MPLILPTTLVGSGSGLSAVWANDGGDKVTQDELRATGSPSSVTNTCWDGTTIKQFGAMNEVVSFNVILEAAHSAAPVVAVTMSNLTGPGGTIRCNQGRGTAGNNLYNWTTTEAELFYVRYLQIRGLSSTLTSDGYSLTGTAFEPELPQKLKLPFIGGVYTGGYANRPNASKFYPEIPVPLELAPTFAITQGENQSVWVDIYIPKAIGAGAYIGNVTVSENGIGTHTIPVTLTVRNFTLPDLPSLPGMVDTAYGDVTQRYTGTTFPVIGSAADLLGRQVLFNQQLVSHRHKITCIGDDIDFALGIYTQNPSSAYQQYVLGTAYSTGNGYAGPGLNTPISAYAIGMYGHWQNTSWPATQAGFQTNTNAWETWFEANAPTVKRFVYLADESISYQQVQTWANWMATNPGIGVNIQSMASIGAITNVPGFSTAGPHGSGWVPSWCCYSGGTVYQSILAKQNPSVAPPNATYWSVYLTGLSGSYNTVATLEPDLHIVMTVFGAGLTSAWTSSVAQVQGTANYEYWMYNGYRPGQGTFHTEADGVDLRSMMWGAYKKGVKRWFFWEGTYYNDNQTGSNPPFKDLFVESRTYQSTATVPDASVGLKGSNGDGVLFYPGTQALPSGGTSYGVGGPFASLRMKHWRRGIQDVDYITLANAINPSAVTSLVQSMVPSVLWENTVHDPADPSYYINTPQSWSADPNVWEAARLQLANICDPQLSFPLLGGMYIAGSVQTAWGTSAFQGQVAKLGVAVVGTYPGWTGGGFTNSSAAAAVKAINPKIKLAPYHNIMELEPGVGASGSAYSPIFNAATAMNWLLRTSWPSGGITDADGLAQSGLNQTKFTVPGAGAYAGFANYLAWRAAWTAANEYYANYDATYTDNVFYQPRVSADYNQSGSSQTAAAAGQNWRDGYASYFPQLRAQLPAGSLLLGNVADWFNTPITGLTGLLDGGFMEGVVGGASSMEVSKGWAGMMAFYATVMNSTIAPNYTIFAQDGSTTNYAGMRYGLCSCLLDNAYYFHSNNGNYDIVILFDEFSFNLGTATAGPGNPTNSTYSGGGLTVWKQGVYRRDFANGIVLVNPRGNGSQTIVVDAVNNFWHLRGTQDPTTNDASMVAAGGTVTLPDPNVGGTGGSGLFLSRTAT